MATSTTFLFSLCILLILFTISKALNITVVNNCPYTIWPAIQPNGGEHPLQADGFALNTVTHFSFSTPDNHWSGRIWARTGCSYTNNKFTCTTGDCGGLQCNGAGGAPPTTIAQFSLHHGNADYSSYGVSLVDGFNVPMTITPHEGTGNCPVVGCRADLLATCPSSLQYCGEDGHGPVVGCKSGCGAFGSDELCCRNHYNSPHTCQSSSYSEFFKNACPDTYTYAHDNPSVMHECSSPRELKIIFCH